MGLKLVRVVHNEYLIGNPIIVQSYQAKVTRTSVEHLQTGYTAPEYLRVKAMNCWQDKSIHIGIKGG